MFAELTLLICSLSWAASSDCALILTHPSTAFIGKFFATLQSKKPKLLRPQMMSINQSINQSTFISDISP